MAVSFEASETHVSVETGELDRKIFSDQEIFDRELELIFGRAWLFLCHESQLKKAGDFFEAPMGRDNVLVVRQKDGSLKGLLNTCTHRGNAVCRAEEGNTKNFMCTYHGWTFNLAGDLVGVPGLEELYHGDLDPSQHGLREVAQLDTYHGFVFATMDASAPPLYDFLGETGRIGIDLIAARGDMEVIPGIQKFIIPCNWKFAVDNLFDWYHAMITHISAFQSGALPSLPSEQGVKMIDGGGAETPDGTVIKLPGGSAGGDVIKAITCIDTYGHAIAGPTRADGGGLFPDDWRDLPKAQEDLGPVGVDVAGHPNVFPSAWVSPGSSQMSLRIPRSPTETEVWWFSFVDKNASDEMRMATVNVANHVFGPAGVLEQEDGENWAQSTLQTHGYASRKVPQLLKMDLGRGEVVKDDQGPPRIYGTTSEHAQLWTYAAWDVWMSGCDWDELRERTTPPDVL